MKWSFAFANLSLNHEIFAKKQVQYPSNLKIVLFLKGEVEDEYLASCLLMVFVAVSIPKLAKSDSSMYQPQLEVSFIFCYLMQL